MTESHGSRVAPLGRRFTIPLAGSSAFVAAALGSQVLFVQLYLSSLHASTFVIGLVSSLNAAGILVGSLFWGAICDRRARRPVLVMTSVGFAGALGVLALLPNTGLVLGTAFVRLLMFSGYSAVVIAIISGASREQHRGRNLSYATSARAFGFALGSILAGFALERLGFRISFLLFALLPVAGLAFLAALPQDVVPRRPKQSGAWHLAVSAGLLDPYLATVLRQMAMFGTFSLLFVYMATLEIPIRLMGIIGSLNTLTQVLALIAFGWLADRVGRRRVFMLGFALPVLTPCMFVLVPNAMGMALGYVTLGLSFSSLFIGSAAHIGDRVPQDRQGTMLGLYESSRGLGGLLGPLVAGAIVPAVGFAGMFLTMAAIPALDLVVMWVGHAVSRGHPRNRDAK